MSRLDRNALGRAPKGRFGCSMDRLGLRARGPFPGLVGGPRGLVMWMLMVGGPRCLDQWMG